MAKLFLEGQRIDVIEVFARVNHPVLGIHECKLGTQTVVTKTHDDLSVSTPTGWYFFPDEVKKCGYYLKVKSLKGGNNE